MNLKLFCLIHNERPYRHYYYQPNSLKHPNNPGWLWEIKCFFDRYAKAAVLPFCPKYNTQLFPGSRKSKVRMLWENLVWCFKYKEPCRYYFLYGLDLKGRNPKDYVAYTEFRVLRNILNFRQRENLPTLYTFNYLALTRDKYVFGQYLESLKMPVPKTLALVQNGKINFLEGKGWEELDTFTLAQKEFSAFCKVCTGEGGKGAFPLLVEKSHYYIGKEKVSISDLKKQFGNTNYIIQSKVKNHPLISEIYPDSINTIRLITVKKEERYEFYDAVFRTGMNGNFVDNACNGGFLLGLDKNGILTDWGIIETDKTGHALIKEKHPTTGFRFAGVKIPFFEEAKQKALELHSHYYGIPLMGWDIAITENGPVFLEAGEDWEIQMHQFFDGGDRNKFQYFIDEALKVKIRKY